MFRRVLRQCRLLALYLRAPSTLAFGNFFQALAGRALKGMRIGEVMILIDSRAWERGGGERTGQCCPFGV